MTASPIHFGNEGLLARKANQGLSVATLVWHAFLIHPEKMIAKPEKNIAILNHTRYNTFMPDTTPPSKPRRGAVTKSKSILIGAWIPTPIVQQMDAAVQANDTDRSKLLRAALRAYLSRASA